MTGKAVTLPGLTTGNIASESMTDSEAVQRTIENLTRTISEFREADMRKKLKECQSHRIMSYQHRGEYVEGDKVWYQPMNGNAWLGPAAVLCQRGPSVWLHSQGDIKKVAACRVRPYNLENNVVEEKEVEEEQLKSDEKEHVMLEDSLQDVDMLHAELEKDITGAKYLTEMAGALYYKTKV